MKPLITATLTSILWYADHALLFILAPLVVLDTGGQDYLIGLAALLYDAFYIVVSPSAGRLGDLGWRRLTIAVSSVLMLFAGLTLYASLTTHNAILALMGKLLLGIAGGLAIPNISSLIVDLGVGKGRRPEELLSKYYGFSSAAGWLMGYLLGWLATRSYGLQAAIMLTLCLAIVLTLATRLLPPPPTTLEHSVPVIKARIRLLHERIMRARFPHIADIRRLFRAPPLLWFYLSIAAGFTGISFFFTMLPYYWVEERGLTYDEVMLYASIHTLASSLTFLVAHRLIEALGAHNTLIMAFLARSLVFAQPLVTEHILPPQHQAALTYMLTGLTWAILNTSLNTVALELRIGGRGTRLGIAQSASATGLVMGDAGASIVSYITSVRLCFAIASVLEIAAATLYAWFTRGKR
ncbi:major facilitator superfamily MFS_1 [Pyrolobus fumarii 1A]|uniref:Major facilitator superfamily MFS_1 n=1 Tax=Pyrolobus fumarii (strain DSM 11204 / 1A) TaxID=694429 RepID=G0EDI5_PYRF1|nr:MFS transporter [Pyrolobus fumarii]AEM38670.1 major facilitator superfamily MFS_1 [Pyrolobus fumarii 1A]